MEERGIYGGSEVICGGLFSSGGSIGKMDGLCVWVEMLE